MNTNFKVIGLIRLEIKPESTVQEADALTTRPFELYNFYIYIRDCSEGLSCEQPTTDAQKVIFIFPGKMFCCRFMRLPSRKVNLRPILKFMQQQNFF